MRYRLQAHKKIALIFLALFVLIDGWLYFTWTTRSPALQTLLIEGRVSVPIFSDHWREEIREQGAQKASVDMIEFGSTLDNTNAHLLAHSFGLALLDELGLEGFRFCTVDYAYGCYDEFIGVAVSREGRTALASLREKCTSDRKGDLFGCTHSLGHGILSSMGYDAESLTNALNVCDSYGDDLGCANGVFMEYNGRGMAHSIDRRPIARPYHPEEDDAPCSIAPEAHRSMCIFEFSWWRLFTFLNSGTGMTESYELVGAMCDRFSGTDRSFCFSGVGFYATQMASLDTQLARSYCEHAARKSSDLRECISAAASRLQEERQSNDISVCTEFNLSGPDHAYCSAYVTRAAESAGVRVWSSNL